MQDYIKVRGAKEHNLKNVNLDIPRNKFVVITGLSGSGKSSLAFDTIYAEGQRRYVESLSSYARQFLHLQDKPAVDSVSGLSPAIAIDQKTTSKNPRSTVGTITEIYDYLRLLYARVGVPYSPATGLPIKSQTVSEMVDIVRNFVVGTKIYILSPIIRGKKGEFRKEIFDLKKQGFAKLIVNNKEYDIDNLLKFEKNKKYNIEVIVDRLIIDNDMGNRISDSLELALSISDGIVFIQKISTDSEENISFLEGERIILSEKFSCPISGFQILEIEPRIFSFNSPFGACAHCEGMGKELFFDQSLIIPDRTISIKDGAIKPWQKITSKLFLETLKALSRHYNFDLDTPFFKLSDSVRHMLLYGSAEDVIKFEYHDGLKSHTVHHPFAGIISSLEEKEKKTESNLLKDELSRYKSEKKCGICNGYRLKTESLCIKIAHQHIGEVSNMGLLNLKKWLNALTDVLSVKESMIADRILKEIIQRVDFLLNVGLDYLNLSRESSTLSGGESQRIRLASQIGSGLSGVLYVLDEPSIGLHQRDNAKLINTLKNLRDLGNTVLVVEHDEETMQAADYIIDVGPGAGIHGGHIIGQGGLEDIKKNINSITGNYLSRRQTIDIPKVRRTINSNKLIKLAGASSNNLKNINIDIPLGLFTAVTGVSGGGKSTLVIHTLYKALVRFLDTGSKVLPGRYESITGLENLDKVIDINQSPIGRTPRSNPATYTGSFTYIRDWFAELPASKARGYKVGRFSFNVKGGRCETCQGDGLIKIEMHFLPDVYVKCDVCNGARYNRETLEIKYKDKSIADVLMMTVEDAMFFFDKVPEIYTKLVTLHEVGLGYIRIGQSATTLSGGEAQRVKLAKELSKRSTGKTLYILDEPTTGLHIDDIKKLLHVLHKLVEMGNTVLVIEHNLDVIKTADYVIDIGPEGGDAGGEVVAIGSPEEIILCDSSYTGQYLKSYLL